MKRALIAFLMLSLTALNGCVALSQSDQDARTAATDWLALLDAGQYQKAYEARPPRIQSKVYEPQFLSYMQTRRAPLGKTISREFFRVTYTKTLIGAPDGNYGIIFFKSSFEHKAHCYEKVTVTSETGLWQVSGYSIH